MFRKNRAATGRVVGGILALSAVIAFAAPSAAVMCDAHVGFNGLTSGTVYSRGTGYPPLTDLFEEDGIVVASRRLLVAGSHYYDEGRVLDAITSPDRFGRGLVFRMDSFGLHFDLSEIGLEVTEVSFRFYDRAGRAGTENLRVNGTSFFEGELEDAPSAIAPGVTCSVTIDPGTTEKRGKVTLSGPVEHFVVAGQEFTIDNVCVIGSVPEPADPPDPPGTLRSDGGSDAAAQSAEASQDPPTSIEATSWGTVKCLYR